MKKLLLFLSLIALALTLSNCDSTTSNPLDVSNLDTLATQDVLTAFQIYSDLYNYVDKIAKYEEVNHSYDFTVDAIHVVITPADTTSAAHTYTMDFANVANHSGSISGALVGKYSTAGAVMTLNFNNYKANNNTVAGNYVITNAGNNTLNVILQNGQITKSDNSIITYATSMSVGVTTDNYSFGLPGSYTTPQTYGTTSNGKSFKLYTETSLVKPTACQYVETGIMDMKIDWTDTNGAQSLSAKINFGCDATGAVNNQCDDWIGAQIPPLTTYLPLRLH